MKMNNYNTTTFKEVAKAGNVYTVFEKFSGHRLAGPMSGAEAVDAFGEYTYCGGYTTGFTADGHTADVWVHRSFNR